jgi:outer membrane protein assembly factor BamB
MLRQLAGVLVWLVFGTVAVAGNWPNWRGADFSGVAPGSGYPTQWSKTENVLWRADLPGRGASTPIVWGERIIVTCAVDGGNGVLCLDSAGKLVWKKAIGTERPGKKDKASGCNPSAVTDGERLYVYFKSGDLACLDFSGEVLWQQNLQALYGADTLWWDLGTSPVLTKDNVVIAVIQTGPSYVGAFDRKTGKPAWKVERKSNAPVESAQSYTTPVVVNDDGKEILVVLGADIVTAHQASDGKELWRVEGLNPTGQQNFRSISSPIVAHGIVVAPYARGATLTAIRLGGTGNVTKSHVVWSKADRLAADVPTPATQDGKVYFCTDMGVISCLDLKTGDVVWTGRTERSGTAFSSSPVIVDGKIYVTREDGTTFVVKQGPAFELLGKNELEGESVVATPVFVDGRILIRTREHLYCIGK